MNDSFDDSLKLTRSENCRLFGTWLNPAVATIECLRIQTAVYLRSFTPFLPATVFFGPLRVRALVRVR